MSISTLNKIAVPVDQASNNATLMPKLQYRFRVRLTSFGKGTDATNDSGKVLTRQVVDITRPNVSFEQITIDTYNSRAYMAGKHTWEPVTLTLRDDASNNVQKEVGAQLQKQFNFFEQSSAVSTEDYKFETIIEILDGGNGATPLQVLDAFHLVGCYIESANYNTLAYNTNDPATISLTIRYDNAIQYGSGGGNQNTNILGIGGEQSPNTSTDGFITGSSSSTAS